MQLILPTIKAGADINKTSPGGITILKNTTAFLIATRAGSFECVELLFQNGANTQARTGINGTPLYYAVNNKYFEIIHLILKFQIKNQTFNYEDTKNAKECAENNKDQLILQILRRYELENAVVNGDLLNIKKILDSSINSHQIELNDTFENGNTFLHVACLNQYFHLVQYLISKGADINAINNKGETSLMVAIQSGKNAELIVRTLLTHGATVGAFDLSYKTELMHVAERGQVSLFDLFTSLSHYPHSLDAKDKLGNNLLSLAAKYSKDVRLIKKLIALGISIDDLNFQNETPFKLAISTQNKEAIVVIAAARILFLIANHQIECPDQNVLDELFNMGGHVYQHDRQNRTLMFVTVTGDSTQFAEYLINRYDQDLPFVEPEDENHIDLVYPTQDLIDNIAVLPEILKNLVATLSQSTTINLPLNIEESSQVNSVQTFKKPIIIAFK